MKKRFLQFSFIAVLALFITMVSLQGISLTASTDGEIDGELTSSNYNNRAYVSAFNLTTGGAQVGTGTNLDPQSDYTVEITVTDPDTIDDLNSLEVRFFYADVDLGSSTPAAVQSAFEDPRSDSVDNSGDAFVVVWNKDDASFTISDGGITGYSWDLIDGSSVVPSGSDYDLTEFKFVFEFKISEVAKQSTGNVRWYFGTIINDGNVSLDLGADDTDVVDYALKLGSHENMSAETPSGYAMNWYGKITVSTQSIGWEDVSAGEKFDGANSTQTISGITFVSNGGYESQIKSSELWEAVLTASQAAVLFDGFTEQDFIDFESQYNGLQDLSSHTGSALAGLTYNTINTVSVSVASITNGSVWNGFEVLLPQSSDNANLTGATIITESGVINGVNFREQYFLIGYAFDTNGNNNVAETTVDGFNLVGTDFRGFKPTAGYAQVRTDETGHDVDLDLKLYLSDVFQNARYKGLLTLKVTNAVDNIGEGS